MALVAFFAVWSLGLCLVIGLTFQLRLDTPSDAPFDNDVQMRNAQKLLLGSVATPPAFLPSPEDDILVVIHTTPMHFDRALAVAETWGGMVRTIFILPKICETEDSAGVEKVCFTLEHYSYLKIDVKFVSGIQHCYEYPPVRPWLRGLQMVKDYAFKWLLKCDDDVYVNIDRLRWFLKGMEQGPCKTVPCYFGSVGYGRKLEEHLLGLNGHPFVMGGPCVVMSRLALERVSPLLPSCMMEPAWRVHSDSQLGRCFLQLNISAGLPHLKVEILNQLFKQYYPTLRKLDGETIEPFAGTTVPRMLLPEDRYRFSLHTIKTREEMHLVHAQLRWNAKPVFSGKSNQDMNCAFHQAVAGSGIPLRGKYPLGAEVSNESEIEHWRKFPSCSIPPSTRNDFSVCMAYVISLNVTSKHVHRLQSILLPVVGQVIVWPAVDGSKQNYKKSRRTRGENGLKESFSAIFRHALSKQYQNILVLEEDALLRLDFEAWWQNASQSECLHNAHMDQDVPGAELFRDVPGVVLLGGTVYGNDVWSVIEEQVSVEELRGTDGVVGCFDAPPGLYGAFATLYNTRLLPIVLNWLETYDEPFDWIYGYLSAQGYSVKALAPFLAIMELNKTSTVADRTAITVKERLHLHRWDPSVYMQYAS